MPSSHLILCLPLLLMPSISPSIRVFSKESTLSIRWPKYWSFSFSISPSNEYSGLISFRMDWLDLLAAQGTLKSLLQHHSSKASILQSSVFSMAQLSHPYMTTGKTISLTIWTFVGNAISLLFNKQFRFVIKGRLSWLTKQGNHAGGGHLCPTSLPNHFPRVECQPVRIRCLELEQPSWDHEDRHCWDAKGWGWGSWGGEVGKEASLWWLCWAVTITSSGGEKAAC